MNPSPPLRIAMWSGPRNISTAMMRAWGSRPDTFVCDEPLYAHYLSATGKPHPISEEVIAHGEPDWKRAVDWLTGEVPQGKSIFYQKQMAHHLLPSIERGWLSQVTNCFLIRDPREVITSYIKKQPDPTLEDLGFVQQAEIFAWLRERGHKAPVLDARDVLDNPEKMLRALCQVLEIEFLPSMLLWQPGLHPSDGIWAKHWYSEVETSTQFRPYQPKPEPIPERLRGVYEQSLEFYERLYEHRLR